VSRVGGLEDEGAVRSSMPFDGGAVSGAAIYCSDGRFGEHFDVFLDQRLGSGRYGLVAVPGGAGAIVEAGNDAFEQLRFVIEVHNLGRVVLISHERCAYYGARGGHPDDVRRRQVEELHAAARQIAAIGPQVVVEAWYAAVEGDGVVFRPVVVPDERLRFGR